ncbi:MAG: GNAT family N-acetyltransferase [Myxococcales bacterium]|nr:GNAT family N-acetyltransferase [Myxococcales bacterium]
MLLRARTSDQASALSMCARLPTQPIQVAAWIHDGGLLRSPSTSVLYLESSGGGLAFISELGVVMPHLQQNENISELAWRIGSSARVVVGPSKTTKMLWSQLEKYGAAARLVRDQIHYSITSATFREYPHNVSLSIASLSDLPDIVDASARMAIEESQDDPASRNPKAFRTRIAGRLLHRRDFILRQGKKIVFKGNVCALSPCGGHIEGIYTLPHARGQGIGRAGITWITRWILAQSHRATLLVNKDNVVARRLYESIGFRQSYPSRTVLAR